MDRLKALHVFSRIAETGSFSKCAREMGVGQPAISKAIDALEDELGVKLLSRTTRALSVTDAGRKVLAEARKVLESYDVLLAAADTESAPHGSLRVTCPMALGSLYLMPRLRQFLKTYPGISVHLILTDTFVDLVDQDVDVAIRVGELSESAFIAKKVGEIRRIAVASEKYLAERGAPRTMADLADHDCLVVGRAPVTAWLTRGRGEAYVGTEVKGSVQVDNHLVLCSAALADLGIALAAKFLFMHQGRLRHGLRQVLKKENFKTFPVNILFKENKAMPLRSRLFIDFIFDDLRRWLDDKS